MGVLSENAIIGASAAGGYDIDNSGRFTKGSSAYLSRTPSSTSNRKTWTWSGWAKRGALTDRVDLFGTVSTNGAGSAGEREFRLCWTDADIIQIGSDDGSYLRMDTTPVYRDPSAWYHIVVAMDTTQATNTNRMKLYVNNEQVTALGTTNYPAQNLDTAVNYTHVHDVGGSGTLSDTFDGYLADVNFIDGLALTPASFGETDSLTNEWKAIKYAGSYGTNGFFLEFDSSTGGGSFADSSSFAQTVTQSGAVWNSPAQKKIGDSSIKFDGGYLRLAADSEYAVANNWTMECWVYCTQDPASGGGLNTYLWGAYDSDPDNAGFIMISHGTSGRLDFVIDNYGSYARADDVGLTQNAWHHVAFSRNGSTNYIFVDGVSKSVSNSGSDFSIDSYSTAPSIGAGDHSGSPGGYLMQGYFDEIRFSKVCRYTSNFTPSTTAFASDSDTVLLIHSDFTGTGLGTDSSGQGNNFGPVNLLVTDQMIDTPQNSTGGNFCTLNPLDSGGSMTATEGNLRANTNSGNNPEINATFQIPSTGKWYWEFVDQHGLSIMIGVVDQINTGSVYSNNNSVIYNSGNGNKYNFSSTAAYGASWTTGDIIGVAFNRDDNEITFYKNNSAQPTLTIGGTAAQQARLMPMLGTGTTGTGGGTFNFGQDSSFHGTKTAQGNTDGNDCGDFYYTPPAGYLALCSDNLSDPSIALPEEHFNTILYTGNGTSPQARTVGLKPSFLWIKDRGATNNHVLTDSIRGPNGAGGTGQAGLLYSNVASAEVTGASQVKSYDTDGFTTHSTTYVNENTNTYVAWSWKGSDTPTKTFAVTVTNPGSGNRYTLDGKVSGTNAMPITIEEGGTYTFDQSDNSNSGHPLRFSTTSDGTHGGGSEYTTGVTVSGTPGSAGAKTVITVAASAATLYFYCTAHSGMGAQASTPGSGGGVSNLSGTTAAVVNANTTAGFSIVKYAGSGSAGATVGHGLSQTPDLIIIKNRTGITNWVVNSPIIDSTFVKWAMKLDITEAISADTTIWNSTAPSASVFTLGTAGESNRNNPDNYIAYCFHSVEGYSKIGTYDSNNSTDGPFIYLGFTPAFIMLKCTNATDNWNIYDIKRNGYNGTGGTYQLRADSDAAGFTAAATMVDLVSNGMKIRTNDPGTNGSSRNYLYLAFAESPFKTSRAR